MGEKEMDLLKEWINEKFDNQFNMLNNIHQQTLKTNGRVNNLEKKVNDLEKD